jgi:hypothetical protein
LCAVSRAAALWQGTRALRERTPALRERIAAPRQRIASPGQWQFSLAVRLGDRAPAGQVCAAGPELTVAPGEWISGRRHGLVAIGHAAVS